MSALRDRPGAPATDVPLVIEQLNLVVFVHGSTYRHVFVKPTNLCDARIMLNPMCFSWGPTCSGKSLLKTAGSLGDFRLPPVAVHACRETWTSDHTWEIPNQNGGL